MAESDSIGTAKEVFSLCHASCILFAALNMKKEDIQGKDVIEVGSMDVNGSLRKLAESYKPKHYLGVDIAMGQGVDFVCNAENLLEEFQSACFDVLISTEMLEHVRNWKKVISNFKNIVRIGGTMIVTTRSYGYPYHGYPYDFWRYEVEDIKNIFSDCSIEQVEKDPERGVFVKIRKPNDFTENNLSNYELYSVIANKRVKQLDVMDCRDFFRRHEVKRRIHEIETKVKQLVTVSLF